MKTKLIIIAICIVVNGCASIEQSIGLGATVVGAIGVGMGTAAGGNVRSALVGLGVGAVVGSAVGYLAHRDRHEKETYLKLVSKNNEVSKTPSLTAPEVRRIWVPEKIEGSKYIDGHYEFILERNSVWSR
ncbi:MAG: hypothetical protein HY537_05180 [Deltaproteobacteria bacterium]|nr:hypothetical protein [Deltaproteobacteria bacterium]